jgi:hypothetical protein
MKSLIFLITDSGEVKVTIKSGKLLEILLNLKEVRLALKNLLNILVMTLMQ